MLAPDLLVLGRWWAWHTFVVADVLRSSGALIAGTWAAMHYMGEEYVVRHHSCISSSLSVFSGYISSCHDIVGAARAIQQSIQNSFPELFVLGKPQASVVAFGSRTPSLNILEVGDKMSKKGWHLNALQKPPGLHIACTVRTHVRWGSQQDLTRGGSD
jgi:sphinganine-1-phosphate aldolase